MLVRGQAYPTVSEPSRDLLFQLFLREKVKVFAMNLDLLTGRLVTQLRLPQTELGWAELLAILQTSLREGNALGCSSSEAGPGSY
jgi:hypothetical protein